MFHVYFGRHYGEPIYRLPDEYLGWLSSLKDLTEDVREAVDRELIHREKWEILDRDHRTFEKLSWLPKSRKPEHLTDSMGRKL